MKASGSSKNVGARPPAGASRNDRAIADFRLRPCPRGWRRVGACGSCPCLGWFRGRGFREFPQLSPPTPPSPPRRWRSGRRESGVRAPLSNEVGFRPGAGPRSGLASKSHCGRRGGDSPPADRAHLCPGVCAVAADFRPIRVRLRATSPPSPPPPVRWAPVASPAQRGHPWSFRRFASPQIHGIGLLPLRRPPSAPGLPAPLWRGQWPRPMRAARRPLPPRGSGPGRVGRRGEIAGASKSRSPPKGSATVGNPLGACSRSTPPGRRCGPSPDARSLPPLRWAREWAVSRLRPRNLPWSTVCPPAWGWAVAWVLAPEASRGAAGTVPGENTGLPPASLSAGSAPPSSPGVAQGRSRCTP
jgi:hypothetical protein